MDGSPNNVKTELFDESNVFCLSSNNGLVIFNFFSDVPLPMFIIEQGDRTVQNCHHVLVEYIWRLKCVPAVSTWWWNWKGC